MADVGCDSRKEHICKLLFSPVRSYGCTAPANDNDPPVSSVAGHARWLRGWPHPLPAPGRLPRHLQSASLCQRGPTGAVTGGRLLLKAQLANIPKPSDTNKNVSPFVVRIFIL
jgi:hypothetical protein